LMVVPRLWCCTRDGGCLALWNRPAGGGSKPPCAALVEDRRGERQGEGAAVIASGVGREDERWTRVLCRGRVERCKATSKPRPLVCLGMSLGDTRLLPRRRPAYRQHEPDLGSGMERVKASPDTAAGGPAARGRTPSGRIREELSTVAGHAGGLARSSHEASADRSGGGAKGRGCSGWWTRSTVKGGIACMSRG
jgi:hypothetical protein